MERSAALGAVSTASRLEKQEELNKAAQALDKRFLKLFLERSNLSFFIVKSDEPTEQFTRMLYVDVLSEHIVENGGLLTDEIRDQMLSKYANYQEVEATR